jgi:hypothetical protein
MFDYCNIIWVHLVPYFMSKWNGCVEFNVMLNNMGWNSLEFNIIPCENVFIILEQCLNVGNNHFLQCCIQFNHLKVVGHSQIEKSCL